MASILLIGGRVWQGNEFISADVLTENNLITKVEKSITDKADFVFNATGKIVSSGLCDIHQHIKGLSSDLYGFNAEMGSIPFGVTAAADASAEYGDKLLIENFLVKTKVFVYPLDKNFKIDYNKTEKELEKYGDRAVGVKLYADLFEDLKEFEQAVNFAEKHNLKVMIHTTGSKFSMKTIAEVLRRGDIITHAYHGGKNNSAEDNFQCIKYAKDKGIIIDTGCAGHIHTDFKVFAEGIEQGAIPDTISTDLTKLSVYKRGGNYGLTLCMSIAKSLGMREEDIFKAVTVTPAKILGVGNGEIKVGNFADLSVLEYTEEGFDLTDKAGNRIFSETGYRNVLTLINGEVVFNR